MNSPDPIAPTPTSGILFFDGDCGLCTRSVRFLLWADKKQGLKFAPLQGETAQQRLPVEVRQKDGLSSVLYLPAGGTEADLFQRSGAVAAALIDLGGVWAIFGKLLRWIPEKLRDGAYDFIARNRFKLFRKGACKLPSPSLRNRILE